MGLCTFARVDSNKEMVIQPQRLELDLTFRALADIFGLPREQLLVALALPNNREFVLDLYYELFQRYEARIPGAVIETDYTREPPREIRGPEIMMSELGYTNLEIALVTIFTLEERTHDFDKWPVSKRDYWVRLSPGLVNQLKPFIAKGPAGGRCVKVLPLEYPSAEMAKLSTLRGKLEQELEKVANERSRYAERRLAFEYARRVVVLNERQWRARPKPYERQDAALEALARLREAMEDLDRAASSSKAAEAERSAASKLLQYIAPTSTAAVPIMNALEVIAEQPNAFPSEQVDDFLDEIRRSFVALSLSSLAEEFLTGHLIALLQELVESVSPEVEAALADTGGARFKALWTTDWRDALTAIRAPGDVKDDSPFKKLVEIGGYYDTVLGVIVAALNESTFPILLQRVAHATELDGAAHEYLAHSLATCLLKVVAAAAVPHRVSSQGQLLVAGAHIEGWFLACAIAIDRGDEAALDDLARELRELKLGTTLKGRPLLRELSVVFSLVSACAAADKSQDGTWQNVGKLIVEVLKYSEGVTGLVCAYRVQWELEQQVAATKKLAEHFGNLAAVLGFIVTLGDTVNRWGNMSRERRIGAALALGSATTTLAGMLPFVATSARIARGLTLVGFILGAAEFAWDLAKELTTPGTQEIFEKYFEHALKVEASGGAYDPVRLRSELASVRAALQVALDADAFTKLRGPPGQRDYFGDGDVPTWHLANAMGFPAEHVKLMFGVEDEDVAAKGIRFSPRYEPDTRGAAGVSEPPVDGGALG